MKLSIVIAVLDSHEIVRRQLLHYKKMELDDEVEIIFVDDGSDPPIEYPPYELKNFTIYRTHDKRPWTVELARNVGIRKARGEQVFSTDLDYIIPRNAINSAMNFTEDKMSIKREFGVLDENGDFTQDLDVLREWGLLEERIKTKGTRLPPHPNNFVMKKTCFDLIGLFDESRAGNPYPIGGDAEFKRRWTRFYREGKVTLCDYRPTIYMFPNGQFCGDVDSNPFNLFHNLSRKSEKNHYYKLQRQR